MQTMANPARRARKRAVGHERVIRLIEVGLRGGIKGPHRPPSIKRKDARPATENWTDHSVLDSHDPRCEWRKTQH